jgi:hypothetical protein
MTSAPCCSPWKARHNPPYDRSARTPAPLNASVPSSEAVHPAHRCAADRPQDGGLLLEQVVRGHFEHDRSDGGRLPRRQDPP